MRKSLIPCVAVALVAFGGGLVPAAAPPVPAIDRSALASLQGSWLATHREGEGERVATDRRASLSIAGVLVRERAVGDSFIRPDREIVALDASTSPHSFDLKLPGEGKQVFGIYKIEGDTLILCLDYFGKARPTEFVTKKGDTGRRIFWLKRQKK